MVKLSDVIKKRIGTPTDAAGTTTLMAWFAKVWAQLGLLATSAALTALSGLIGTVTDTSASATLFGKIALHDSKGCIKSVQRGAFNIAASSTGIAVTLASVNPSKCSVNVWGTSYNGGSSNLYVSSLSATSLALAWYGTASANFSGSWEVVEFY